VIYLPYGHYTLQSRVVVRGNVRRIDGMFSEVARSGQGALSVANPAGTVVWLENLATTAGIADDGAGDLVVRNIGPVSGSGSATLTTGAAAAGSLYLENWGPHARINISRPVHVWARQMNREGQSWTISGGAVVWVAGDNVETASGRGHPEVRVTGSTYELIGGAWDNLGDSTSYATSDVAVYQITDSRVSLLIPGLMRNGGVVGHWVNERRSGATVGDVYDSDLVAVMTRRMDVRVRTPLYVSPNA
jgi:hypothetical protein